MTSIFTLPSLPAALVAERDGRWFALQAPWQCAWAGRRPIPRPLAPEPVNIHPNSPLALLSDIPGVARGER